MKEDQYLFLKGFQPTRRRAPNAVLATLFVLTIIVVNYLVFFRDSGLAEVTIEQRLIKPVEPPTKPVENITETEESNTVSLKTAEGVLMKGENLSQLLQRLGVKGSCSTSALEALQRYVDMRTLRVGQKVQVTITMDGTLISLLFPVNEISYIEVEQSLDGYVAQRKEVPTQKEIVELGCLINGSLYESIQRCGEDASLAGLIADVLGTQIDLFTDMRRGDVVRISVEKESVQGRFLRYGKIKGLIYEGRIVKAGVFSFEEGNHWEYFDSEGYSIDRPFLRTPVKYAKITSEYSLKRLHPILHTYLPHRALDYAAPKGTPVYAIGDGKIIMAGKAGPAGNQIVISHEGDIQSYYAHLSQFAKDLKVGDKVKKGTVIGYVGTTGRATGPHLHFALAKGGQFVHPKILQSIRGKKISADKDHLFKQTVNSIINELKALPVRGTGIYKS